eukprot:s5484_g3.t2
MFAFQCASCLLAVRRLAQMSAFWEDSATVDLSGEVEKASEVHPGKVAVHQLLAAGPLPAAAFCALPEKPPPQNFTSFAPEPRRAPEPQMPKASAPAASTPASSAGDAWKRQEATTRGLSSDQFEAVLSIESLLGFDFSRALQAFISAGSPPQELAANLLLEEGQEAPEQPLANFGAPGLPQPSYIVTRTGGRVPGAFPGPPLDEKQWRLSPSEEAAVKRLQDLGFDRPTAFKVLLERSVEWARREGGGWCLQARPPNPKASAHGCSLATAETKAWRKDEEVAGTAIACLHGENSMRGDLEIRAEVSDQLQEDQLLRVAFLAS